MASDIGVPIQNVVDPTYLRTRLQADDPVTTEPVDASLEIYSGLLLLQAREGDGHLQHYDYQSFVPISPGRIRQYDPSSRELLFDATVTMALAGVAPADNEANISSIDTVSVKLVPRAFLGLNGEPNILVLEFTIGILNTEIIRVSYSIAVSSRTTAKRDNIDVPNDTTPSV
jgi:hypothetical protein